MHADLVEPPLQPLRISPGWTMDYCRFFEVDPDPAQVLEDDRWWLFKEDLLQLTHKRNRLLDLGFYPEGDLVQGVYRVVVYEGDFQGTLLFTFESRDRRMVVAEIERALHDVSAGQL